MIVFRDNVDLSAVDSANRQIKLDRENWLCSEISFPRGSKMRGTTSSAKKRILCLDDDQDTRDMMRMLLRDYGYEPVIAASASDALDGAEAGGFDLFILDHWLTESDGITLCRQIRGFDACTPIMFYSGAGFKADLQKGLDAGAEAYLVKPDFDNLKQTIDRLIEEANSRLPVVRRDSQWEGVVHSDASSSATSARKSTPRYAVAR
jgi:CheY-like chemotaxis protein